MNQARLQIIAISVLVISVILAFVLGGPFKRNSSPIPFYLDSKLNKSLELYAHTRPSRYVMAIVGPAKSGKSRTLNNVAHSLPYLDNTPIILDFNEVHTLDDLIFTTKVAVINAMLKSCPYLSSADYKSIINVTKYNNINMSIDDIQFDQVTSVPLKAIFYSLDKLQLKGFNEYAIVEFLQVLEDYEAAFHFTLFIHNYDSILNVVDKDGNVVGHKISNAAKAFITKRDQYVQNVPIFVELKDSSNRLNATQYTIQLIHPPSIIKYTNKLVRSKYFTKAEMKTILSTIGPIPGPIVSLHTDLVYGQPFNFALEKLISSIRSEVRSLNVTAKSPLAAELCQGNGRAKATSAEALEPLKPLFQNGLLFLRSGMKVRASSPEVIKAICELN